MAKYLAIKMVGRGKVLKEFRTPSAALKWRTASYKKKKGTRIGILGARGFIGPQSYGRR